MPAPIPPAPQPPAPQQTTPKAKSRAQRLTRQSVGTRSNAPDVLAPDAMLADDLPVSADADDRLPPDLEFTPVPRKPRSNGLTPKRQRLFVRYLAVTGSVTAACRIIGCSTFAIYNLKHAPHAEGFAAAWERAVERGARRVRDVMLDQAINGIPERVYRDGQLVAERRLFNTRAQMFIVAHDQPERYGVPGGLMHTPSAQSPEKRPKWLPRELSREEAADNIQRRVNAIRAGFKASIANDPAKRAAWDLIAGPTDWDDFTNLPDCGRSRNASPTNQNRPDIILTMAAPLGEDGETVAECLFSVEEEDEGEREE